LSFSDVAEVGYGPMVTTTHPRPSISAATSSPGARIKPRVNQPSDIDPAPENLFRVEAIVENDVARLAVIGDIDLSAVATLEQRARAAVSMHRPSRLVVDLREATFLDSTGIRLLLSLEHEACDGGYRFTLVRGPVEVQRALEVTGLREQSDTVDDPAHVPAPGEPPQDPAP
jgi:anti-anti-sigma factor